MPVYSAHLWNTELNRPDREGLTSGSDTTPATDPQTNEPIVDFFVLDNTHPITLGLPLEPDTAVVHNSGQAMSGSSGDLAPGAVGRVAASRNIQAAETFG